MSDDDGPEYAFLSVLRRGLAALVQPGTPAGDPRVAVPVTLATGGSSVTGPALALYGPGDVAGFDAGHRAAHLARGGRRERRVELLPARRAQ